jgi:hypothetical protein
VLPAEHLLDLARLHLLIERVEGVADLGVHGLSRFGPLEQDGQIISSFLQRAYEGEVLLEPAQTLLNLLSFGLVFPEIGRGGAGLEAGQFFFRT